MIIERFLNPQQLKRYRAWKQDVRATIRLWRETLALALRNGDLTRLLDRDFIPVFICGAAGSGMTLIAGLLDQVYQNEICMYESNRMLETGGALWLEKSTYYDALDEYYQDLIRPRRYPVSKVRRATLGLYRRLSAYPRRSKFVLDKAPNAHLVRMGPLHKAFPASKVVLIYRDPVEVIEGFKRKWPRPYGKSSVEALCDFYNELHEIFMHDAKDFGEDLIALSYQQLVEDPEHWVEEIGRWAGLRRRKNALEYRDQPNRPGKGLRNVVDGKIEVVKDAFHDVKQTFSQEETALIRARTRAVVTKLESLGSANAAAKPYAKHEKVKA